MNSIQHANEILKELKTKNNTDSVAVWLSLGKDSLVLLDLVYKSNLWNKIYCIYLYLAPNLDHITKRQKLLSAKYDNTLIWHNMPHMDTISFLKDGIFCNPNPAIKRTKIKDLEAKARDELGFYWTLSGWKQMDSLDRMVTLNTYEMQGIVADHKRAYPITKMTHKEVFAYMDRYKLLKPLSYGNKNMSGLGLNPYCFEFLKNTYPQDLAKIQKIFPYFSY
jgi:sulfate adenylyltransferase subunit 2